MEKVLKYIEILLKNSHKYKYLLIRYIIFTCKHKKLLSPTLFFYRVWRFSSPVGKAMLWTLIGLRRSNNAYQKGVENMSISAVSGYNTGNEYQKWVDQAAADAEALENRLGVKTSETQSLFQLLLIHLQFPGLVNA